MKSQFFILLSLIISFSLNARTLTTQVHSLEEGSVGEAHIIRLVDGEVVFIPFGEKSLLKAMKDLRQGDEVKLQVDKNHNLVSIEESSPLSRESLNKDDNTDVFVPSVLTLKQAGNIFRKMSRKYQNKSQCFNRAHIWVYDEYMRSKTNLNKVFLFFTSRYIRKYRFHWWFHVTPMAYVGGTQFKNWRMLDRRYTKGPLQSKTWTNIFIKSKRTCRVTDKFSDYSKNVTNEDCFLIEASQYYLVPSDLDMLESDGIERTSFDPVEVEHARWEAF